MGDISFGSLRMIDKKVLFKRHVEVVNLELSYECNRKCDYYPVSFSDRQNTQSYMDKDLIEKICIELSEIRYDNRISLNLYNEPLLDENLAIRWVLFVVIYPQLILDSTQMVTFYDYL